MRRLLLYCVLFVFAYGQTELTSGVPVIGSVLRQSFASYYIQVPSSNSYDLVIELDQLSGSTSTDIYIRYSQPPTLSEYAGYNSASADPKTLFWGSCYSTGGTWYISVYGDTSTSYTSRDFNLTATLGMK